MLPTPAKSAPWVTANRTARSRALPRGSRPGRRRRPAQRTGALCGIRARGIAPHAVASVRRNVPKEAAAGLLIQSPYRLQTVGIP